MQKNLSERSIVFLVGAIQFVNILDFMMVMPLGPDFARALEIDSSKLGLIGGSYTAAAAISGLVGSFFLDRFDRRKALAVAMLGLVLGTAAGGLATGLYTLMAARVIAGLFGGPATSLALSIVADVIPKERLGRAMGAVMGAFSVSSVVGVPLALRLSLWGDWNTPFFVVAGMGFLVALGAVFLLPPMTLHLQAKQARKGPETGTWELVRRPEVMLSYGMTAMAMMAGFVMIPAISPYVQENLGYPREDLELLFAAGGVCSFIAMRYLAGPLVDRFGAVRIAVIGVVLQLFVLYVGFYSYVSWFPVVGIFVGFMTAMAFRNVPYNTLTSRVPASFERARFMSLQSVVQHIASAAGAILSAQLLTELPDKKLAGIPDAALASMIFSVLVPIFMWMVEKRVKQRDFLESVVSAPSSLAH